MNRFAFAPSLAFAAAACLAAVATAEPFPGEARHLRPAPKPQRTPEPPSDSFGIRQRRRFEQRKGRR